MNSIKLREYAHRITYLSADWNYTWLHFTDAPDLLVAKTLSMCVLELPDFVRIHRRYAVNPGQISDVLFNGRLAEIHIGPTALPISRRRLLEVRGQLNQLNFPN